MANVGPRFLRITDIQDGNVDWLTVPHCETTHSEGEAARLDVGDIVFARTGATTGKSYLLRSCPERTVFASYLIRVRPDRTKIDPRYLSWYFQTPEYWRQITTSASGTAQPGVNASKLSSLVVPVPPIDQQHRIADILDKADAVRRKRRESIALTDELLRSAFLEMFGDSVRNTKEWRVTELGAVSEVGGGLQVTSARASNPIAMPYLRVANVFRDRLDLSEIKQIHVTDAEARRSLLHPGDVLVVEGHGNPDELGRAAVWRGEILRCTHQNHLIRIRPDARLINPAFLCAYLNSSAGRSQMLRLGKTTSGLNTISTNNIRGVTVATPPLDLQQKFERLVNGTRILRDRFLAVNEASEVLFRSLIQRAFEGSSEA